jgi:hypothetical protein
VRVVAAANHCLGLDAIAPDLIHKPLLGQDADADGQLFKVILRRWTRACR